jgi:4-amino-4-deoxy-L-arabinose transferase-like glycosyltransferase
MSEAMPRRVVLLAFLLLLVRLALSAHLELAFDEAYYWNWAQHPALSYYDHPPMVAWFVAVGTAIAGDTEFGVRLLGPFTIFATTLLLMGTVRDLERSQEKWIPVFRPASRQNDARGRFHDSTNRESARGGGRRAMVIVGLFSELTVAAQVLGIVMTPDTPLLLFAALTLRFLAAIVAGGPSWLWLAAGAAGGAALLSKYTAVMIGLGIVIWMLAMPARRRQLATVWPWAGAALALVVFSPVLIWNAQNDWLSFFKQGGRTAAPFQPSFSTFADFLGGQAGLATPLIGIAIAIGLVLMAKEALTRRSEPGVLLAALGLPFLAYLTFYSIGGDVEGNWTVIIAPPGLAAAAMAFGARWDSTLARRFTIAAIALGAAFSAALLLYVVIPFNHSLGRLDMTHRVYGQRELAADVATVARREGLRTIVTDNYGTNALLAFYLPRDLGVIHIMDPDRYRGWTVPESAQSDLASGEVLGVAGEGREYLTIVAFKNFREVGRAERQHRGTVVERFVLYRLSGFQGEY